MFNHCICNMTSDNIFDLWREIGKVTPFIVKRNAWWHLSYKVTRVFPKCQYGDAYGYRMQDGVLEEGAKEELIECSGCGNWQLIENLNENLSEAKWDVLDDDLRFTFGKYKGKTVKEVNEIDAQYLNWAYSCIGGFKETFISKKYNISFDDLQIIKNEIKSKLSFTSDQWFKSSVQNSFESVLGNLVVDVVSGECTASEAAKKMNKIYDNGLN